MNDGQETHDVFAYGANLDRARMRRRCPSATARRPARLEGWRLTFNRLAVERDGTGLANVEPDPEGVVEGALYTVSRADLQRLDQFEGHPGHCSRRLLAVHDRRGERHAAWVYLAVPDWKADGLEPRAGELAAMEAGADVLSLAYRAAHVRPSNQ